MKTETTQPSIKTKKHIIRRKAYLEPPLSQPSLWVNLLLLPVILIGLLFLAKPIGLFLYLSKAAFLERMITGTNLGVQIAYGITVLIVYLLIHNVFNFFNKPKSNQTFSMRKSLIAIGIQSFMLCVITLPSSCLYIYSKMMNVEMSKVGSVGGGGFVLISLFLIGWAFIKLIQFAKQYIKYGKSNITVKPNTLRLGDSMTVEFINAQVPKHCQEVEIFFRNIYEKHEYYVNYQQYALESWVLYQYSHTLPMTRKKVAFEIDIPKDKVFPTNYKAPKYWELIIQNKEAGFYSRFMLDVLPCKN